MKENNVIVLHSAEIYPFLKYVKHKYGNKFIQNCRVRR